jgi:hypothetical protein
MIPREKNQPTFSKLIDQAGNIAGWSGNLAAKLPAVGHS